MVEPTSSTVGLVASGALAGVLAALGLDPAQLLWALVGSAIGVTFAAAASRPRAAVVFVCVVLVCSLAGTALAQYMGGGSVWAKLSACLLAIGFHPLVNAAITRVPALLDGLMRKFGVGGQP